MISTMRPTDAEVMAFQPPPATIGMQVAYFPGSIREQNHLIATVMRVSQSGRALYLKLSSGENKGPCLHINDPKLRFAEDAAAEGAWDFTLEAQEQRQQIQDLLNRISTLEGRVAALEKPKAKS